MGTANPGPSSYLLVGEYEACSFCLPPLRGAGDSSLRIE